MIVCRYYCFKAFLWSIEVEVLYIWGCIHLQFVVCNRWRQFSGKRLSLLILQSILIIDNWNIWRNMKRLFWNRKSLCGKVCGGVGARPSWWTALHRNKQGLNFGISLHFIKLWAIIPLPPHNCRSENFPCKSQSNPKIIKSLFSWLR